MRRAVAILFGATMAAATCIAAISGCAGDPTTLGAGFTAGDSGTRLAAIRTAARDNDVSKVPDIARRLNDDDPAVRVAAIAALRRLTGQDYGYSPSGSEAEREAIMRRFIDTHRQQQSTGGTGR
jgi:HEAT repeat protein